MQHQRVEIGAVRPHDRSGVLVRPDLREEHGVVQSLEHALKGGRAPNVYFTVRAIVESKTETTLGITSTASSGDLRPHGLQSDPERR